MVFKTMFHLLPLVGVVLHRVNLILGLLLVVALPYIKVKKLENIISGQDPSAGNKSRESLEKTLRFWKAFTFIK